MTGKPINSAPSLGRTQPSEHRYHTRGMLVPLPGTNGVVPGSLKPLPNMGCRRDSVDRITRSQTKGDTPGGEHDAGFAMDQRK